MLNILIVDDERNIREGIVKLIDWDSYGCRVVNSCANGNAALQYIKENPVDIVVTDIKMPLMYGLELSKNIYESYPAIKVIILTAYSDFEMAKRAIRFGVSDFIIKNDFIDELPKAIEKASKLIDEERKNNSAPEPVLGRDEILKKFYRSVVFDKRNVQAVPGAPNLSDRSFCMCACVVDDYDKKAEGRDLTDMFGNIMKIALKDCEYTILPVNGDFFAVVISYEKNGNVNLNRIVDYFNNILIMIEEFMRIDVKFGLSRVVESADKLSDAYEDARTALSRITTGGSGIKVFGELVMEAGGDFDPDQYINRISDMTFDESRDEAADYLKEFCDRLSTSRCSFEQCQLYMLVICSTVIHRAVKYHLDVDQDFDKMERDVFDRIHSAKTMFSLNNIGRDIIEKVRALCIGKKNFKNELVKRVDECIKQHYKEELTLQFISDELYLSSSYVSRAYKKLTGINITEKITMYRVGKAKELLENGSLKIYEVAANVGFKDPAYFTNVFIKYTNMNPSEYRAKFL
ncbi:MAG: response regulator [Lachnospiraceae bacterium]|nr:response regulator [Lachnospiraceae bacterium]